MEGIDWETWGPWAVVILGWLSLSGWGVSCYLHYKRLQNEKWIRKLQGRLDDLAQESVRHEADLRLIAEWLTLLLSRTGFFRYLRSRAKENKEAEHDLDLFACLFEMILWALRYPEFLGYRPRLMAQFKGRLGREPNAQRPPTLDGYRMKWRKN